MKEFNKTISAEEIHSKLNRLYADLSQLEQGCTILSSKISTTTLSYKILKKAYDEKLEELNEYKNQLYYIKGE